MSAASAATAAKLAASKKRLADVQAQQKAARGASAPTSPVAAPPFTPPTTAPAMDYGVVNEESKPETKPGLLTTKNVLIGTGVLAALGGVFYWWKKR